jgi:hypothetical protein
MWTSAESDFLLHLFRGKRIENTWKQCVDRPDGGWINKHEVSYSEFAESLGIGIDALFRSRSKGLIWVDQTPGHTLMAETLRDMFPSARFIHIVRDGRDVISSMLSSNFESLGFSMKWATDFNEACRTWAVFADRGHQFVEKNPDIAIEIRNENLRSNGKQVMADLLAFLGLSPNDKPAEFLAKKRVNSSYDSGGKTVVDADQGTSQASRIGPWQDWPSGKKEVFDNLAGDVFKSLGYSIDR